MIRHCEPSLRAGIGLWASGIARGYRAFLLQRATRCIWAGSGTDRRRYTAEPSFPPGAGVAVALGRYLWVGRSPWCRGELAECRDGAFQVELVTMLATPIVSPAS